MPLSYSYPGLYIQEVPSNSNAIVPSPTSIAAFVGYSHPFKTERFNSAQQCFSFNDYVANFGPLFSSGLVDASLPRAVSQFFLNGGSSAWVVGLQPGLFTASGQIMERIGGTSGLAITAATNFVSNAGIFSVSDPSVAPDPFRARAGDRHSWRPGLHFDSHGRPISRPDAKSIGTAPISAPRFSLARKRLPPRFLPPILRVSPTHCRRSQSSIPRPIAPPTA